MKKKKTCLIIYKRVRYLLCVNWTSASVRPSKGQATPSVASVTRTIVKNNGENAVRLRRVRVPIVSLGTTRVEKRTTTNGRGGAQAWCDARRMVPVSLWQLGTYTRRAHNKRSVYIRTRAGGSQTVRRRRDSIHFCFIRFNVLTA